ncbi:MAG: serine hydrolase [Clostridia bacterium]|nr:serine hydrolase [Deltaproteobacteria bacterium]
MGSDTKAMTAALTAMFVDEGKLDWNTTVGDAFAD